MQAQIFLSAILYMPLPAQSATLITSETAEKIYSCKSKGSHGLLNDNSWVEITELVAGLYIAATHCSIQPVPVMHK